MKTDYYTSPTDNFVTQSYFPAQDKVTFISFWSESNARLGNTELVTGMWKLKCVHDWKTNIKELYQECKKCGKGHAL